MMATNDFKDEVLTCANDLGVKPKEIRIQKMKRKWASCSSKGRLTFSFALLEEAKGVRLEAIVHELLHLKYPNHGEMFKALLVAHLSKKGIKASIKF
jgi:hypothetical protein